MWKRIRYEHGDVKKNDVNSVTLEKPNFFSFSIKNYIDFYIVNFALKYSGDIKLQYLLMYSC